MSASGGITFDQLLDLARGKTAAARRLLAETVSDLFLADGTVLTERERALMIDILRRLVHDVEMSIRGTLAERLADRPAAPRELVVELANDDIEVAHSILVRSEVLHGMAGLLDRGDHVGDVVARGIAGTGSGPRQAAADGAK